jgi:hypothetical protein
VAEAFAAGFVSPIIEAIELNIAAESGKSERNVGESTTDLGCVDEG